MNEIQKYILSLDDSATIEELEKIINEEVFVLDTRMSWGKKKPCTDKIIITNIKAHIDLIDKSLTCVMIYGDFFFKGRFKYNAWTALESLKANIKRLDNQTT